MKKNTRKMKSSGALSIPELKNAWDQIHKATDEILREGKPPAQQIKDFQKMWKKIFHRPVSSDSVESYLRIKRLSNGSRRRKTRKMKGGAMPLGGAPIDSTLQPGVYGTHGSFPGYQSAGLGFYDSINKQALFEDCGVKDITPAIGGTIGSNQVGGAFKDVLSIAPYSSLITSPPAVPGVQQNITTAFKGQTMPPSSAPEKLSSL
jgi:hypothetical protein